VQLELTSQNTRNAQDELDKTKEKFLAEKAMTRARLNELLRDNMHLRKKKKALEETIKDMEIERKDTEKAQQKLKKKFNSLRRLSRKASRTMRRR
jgi:hypothetical protein